MSKIKKNKVTSKCSYCISLVRQVIPNPLAKSVSRCRNKICQLWHYIVFWILPNNGIFSSIENKIQKTKYCPKFFFMYFLGKKYWLSSGIGKNWSASRWCLKSTIISLKKFAKWLNSSWIMDNLWYCIKLKSLIEQGSFQASRIWLDSSHDSSNV